MQHLLRPFFSLVLIGLVPWATPPLLHAQETQDRDLTQRPNVLVVLSDDLGYGDVGCYGNRTIETPHIDRLASEGLRLTDCYAAAPNCSPSRAGLMTGRTPYRLGIHDWIPFLSPVHLAADETTIATLLRDAGYATCHVGKWHLNGRFNLPGQPQPNDHGFDHWFATQNNALPNHRDPYNFVRNDIPVGPQQGYSAELVTDEAIRWLTEADRQSQPFFLFVCYHEPHEPIATAPRFAQRYPGDDPSRSAHHGNVSQMDAAFGRLLETIDKASLRENTLVFFTSDNGPAITGRHPHGSAGPLRDKKGSVYEGGIRVPGILRWPGRVKPGSVSEQPVSGVDLLPTLCDVTGIPVPADRVIDGASFLPILDGKPVSRNRPLYWQFNRARSEPKVALRSGPWKLLASLDKTKVSGADITVEDNRALKTAELKDYELYHLREDVGETQNLAAQEAERLRIMVPLLEKMYHEVREETRLWPVWQSPHYEGQRIEWPQYAKPGAAN